MGGAAAGARRLDPAAQSHGDRMRQAARAGIELGRKTTEVTAATWVELLERFKGWLESIDLVFGDLFSSNPPDLDRINNLLTDFGRWLLSLVSRISLQRKNKPSSCT